MSHMVTQLCGFGSAAESADNSLFGIISTAGLTSGLYRCYDIGSADCTDHSSQTLTDLSSAANDFYNGSGSGADAADMTFNGSAGGLSASEFLSTADTTNYLTAAANVASDDAMHKDNAAFTILLVIRTQSNFTPASALIGTHAGSASNTGVLIELNTSGTMRFFVADGSGSAALLATTSDALSTATDYLLALSIDEAGNSGFFWANSAYVQVASADTFAAAYATPSAGAASSTLVIGAYGGGGFPVSSGFRVYGAAFWSTNLSKANLDAIDSAWTRF